MNLETPGVKNEPSRLFPGENWFLYWKTSPSLWKEELSKFQGRGRIYAPLNWQLHMEDGLTCDFGQQKPETDLARLERTALECGLELILLLPLGPFPFLVNGGLPSSLANIMSLRADGLANGVVGRDYHVYKMYSFFDQRIYISFEKFVSDLSGYLNAEACNSRVWGAEAGSLSNHKKHYFIEDRSKAFESAFSRFLAAEKKQVGEQANIKSLVEEVEKIDKFTAETRELYRETAKERFGDRWLGHSFLDVVGAEPSRFVDSVFGQEKPYSLATRLYSALINRQMFSSINNKVSKYDRVLKSFSADVYVPSLLPNIMAEEGEGQEERHGYEILSFFRVYNLEGLDRWESQGLYDFLNEDFGHTYNIVEDICADQLEKTHGQVHLLPGRALDKKTFNLALGHFMTGGRVLIDRNGMNLQLLRKLEMFFLENSLKVEKVNFHTDVHHVKLGLGRLIIYDAAKLAILPSEDRHDFWSKLISTLEISHIHISNDPNILSFWRVRSGGPSELKYEEIRRVNLYNIDERPKRLELALTKSFALIKILDEQSCEVETKNNSVFIKLGANGSVSLDFGLIPQD